MNKSLVYGALALIIIWLDRLSKLYALTHWCDAFEINRYLFLRVSFNRGISWGLLNTPQSSIFVVVSTIIVLVTFGLMWYTYQRYRHGKIIIGEVCVVSGSISNIIDRILCKGVIDFIVVHKNEWAWPVFNLADACIVLGIALMFFNLITEHD